MVLGFDTSNYTTSVAKFDGIHGENQSRLLDVKQGELGLRQSDAVFAHVKRLPELTEALFEHTEPSAISAIGVSTRPREVEGSYMPCFLAGVSVAKSLFNSILFSSATTSFVVSSVVSVTVSSTFVSNSTLFFSLI